MKFPLKTSGPNFRVSLLQPLTMGRARVLKSWVTDGKGAIEALETPREASLAIQVEMEDWEASIPPWATGTFQSPQPTLQ